MNCHMATNAFISLTIQNYNKIDHNIVEVFFQSLRPLINKEFIFLSCLQNACCKNSFSFEIFHLSFKKLKKNYKSVPINSCDFN